MVDVEELLKKLSECDSLHELDVCKSALLGKSGVISRQFKSVSELAPKDRSSRAKLLNDLKNRAESLYRDRKAQLEDMLLDKALSEQSIDVSLFRAQRSLSNGHPISIMRDLVVDYFCGLNFSLQEGPLIESDFYNFEALNLPTHHPARDMQDTFYFADSMLLRTHTSPVQIRTMLSSKPPIRMICAGSVFRRDYDSTHSPMFNQIEGLLVEEGDSVSFANLKFLLEGFLEFIFGDVKIRFRSSFFPFTEPSAEVDISCVFCGGSGCKTCSGTGFLEVLGCGIVDPNVFKSVGYSNVSGYAFGMGVERLAMLKWGVSDMRSFFETDLRVLEQF